MTDMIETGGGAPPAEPRLRMPRAAHRKPWTPEEDEQLRRMLLAGETVGDVAQAMGRTREGIRNRAAGFGLSVTSGPRRPRAL